MFAKCGYFQSHREALEHLLNKTAVLLQPNKVKLDAQGIGTMVYNLRKLARSKGTDTMLNAISQHILSAEQLDPQAIGNALYGLQNMTRSPATDVVLDTISQHIPSAEQLKPQEIGNALYGLQNMTRSPATDAVLDAISQHILSARQMDPQAIGNALYGLQNMTPSPATDAVLSALHKQVQQVNVDSLLIPARHHFLAEAMHSLTPYFNSKPSRMAECLLLTLSERLQVPLPAAFAEASSRQKALFEVLKAAGNIHLNKHSSVRDQQVTAIDLHGLSHALGEIFCDIALRLLFLEGGVSPIDIVYGASNHKASNQDKMRARVERVLAGSAFGNVSKDFQGAFVRVDRKAVLNSHAKPSIPRARARRAR